MKFIRQRLLAGELLTGTWCNLGSEISAEITGDAGFDWILIDMEHGNGDLGDMRAQLQAASGTRAAALVRDFEPDLEVASTLYRQAERELVDNAACLPLWFGQNYILAKPYVKGYHQNPMGFVWLNEVTVEPH